MTSHSQDGVSAATPRPSINGSRGSGNDDMPLSRWRLDRHSPDLLYMAAKKSGKKQGPPRVCLEGCLRAMPTPIPPGAIFPRRFRECGHGLCTQRRRGRAAVGQAPTGSGGVRLSLSGSCCCRRRHLERGRCPTRQALPPSCEGQTCSTALWPQGGSTAGAAQPRPLSSSASADLYLQTRPRAPWAGPGGTGR